MNWTPIISSPLLMSAVILVGVVCLEALWYWPTKFHPLTFFRFIAHRMEKRVNRAQKSSPGQNRIAGSLGMLLLIAPFAICIQLFLSLVHFRWFFDALVLLIALSFHADFRQYKRVRRTVEAQQKHLAKDGLNQLVLRKTETLSPLGCAKAAMESIVLRFYYQFVTIVFWYLVAGPVAALVVRLVYECRQVWNIKHNRTRFFGAPANGLFNLLCALPCYLGSLVIGLFYRPFATLPVWFSQLTQSLRQRIVSLTAVAIQAELGGPVIYETNKLRLLRFNRASPTKVGHLNVMQQYVQGAKVIILVNSILILTIIYGLTL